jgi:signal transduction histidine kinase
MWRRLTLRIRIYLILSTLVIITMAGGLVMVWYTYRMDDLLTQIVDKNVAAFETAEALMTALVNQKGFVSYYFLDGDPDWLRQLGEYRQIFRERLKEARGLVETDQEMGDIDLIDSEYAQYVSSKDRVISLYKAGERKAGAELHKQVRRHFFRILDLCEEYKQRHADRILKARDSNRSQAERLRIIAGSAMLVSLLLALLLIFVLVKQVLGPVRKLARETDTETTTDYPGDEVKALSRRVRGLIADMDHTHSELEKSRETLLQAEKLALVGKLAAGTAHSIRNPLTSVNMRLFSLGRALNLTPEQREDLGVISEEIRHIDTIVQNFLEFSRPPKLKMQRISPSDVVDMAVQLLQHRLKSYDVAIRIDREGRLPEIEADPEQLKEVLVNLVVNACEAMNRGGQIVIQEKEGDYPDVGRVVVIRLADNGPGIPDSIQDKILQPFFTTKEEGTGLGLSIAARILEEHGGNLDLISEEGEGATFVVTLPIKEPHLE